MYQLTLTSDERRAIDWIGNRYFHGDELYHLLAQCEWSAGDFQWGDAQNITFTIPEHIAWMVREGFEDENYEFTCLAPELANKLMMFCEQIV